VFDKTERKDGTFQRNDFQWNEEHDEYRWPAGNALRREWRPFKNPRTHITKADTILLSIKQVYADGPGFLEGPHWRHKKVCIALPAVDENHDKAFWTLLFVNNKETAMEKWSGRCGWLRHWATPGDMYFYGTMPMRCTRQQSHFRDCRSPCSMCPFFANTWSGMRLGSS